MYRPKSLNMYLVILTVTNCLYFVQHSTLAAVTEGPRDGAGTSSTLVPIITRVLTPPARCDPITLRSCPGDIQKLVVPGSNGISVSWDPPTLEATNCTVEETQSHQIGEFFPPLTTVVSYLFHDINGDQKVYCNFTVNITTAQCKQDEFQCYTSGRCIPGTGGNNGLGQRCDFFPDCPDRSDENSESCSERLEECLETGELRNAMLDSCSIKRRLQSDFIEVPRRKRQGDQEEGTPGIWRFTTDDQPSTFITNIGVRTIDLFENTGLRFPKPPAEFAIRIKTSKSLHDLTTYLAAGEESRILTRRLRQPLQLMANEEVTISLAYTTDPLNEPAEPIRLNFPCPSCVEVNTRVFVSSDCEDNRFLTCLNNFHAWNLANDKASSCGPEEDSQLYIDLYGNQCLTSPEITHLTTDQQLFFGDTTDLVCVVDGRPLPIVWWVNEALEAVTDATPSNSVLQVAVTDSESSYFCQYESSAGSGISKAVAVSPLSSSCSEQSQQASDLLGGNAASTCTRTYTSYSAYPQTITDQQNRRVLSFRYFPEIDRSTSDGAVAFAFSVNVDVFLGLRPSDVSSPITSFLLSISEKRIVPQRKRDVVPTLYTKRYDYVNTQPSTDFVVFPFDTPVHFGHMYDFSEVNVLLTFIEWTTPSFVETDGNGHLNYTQCTNADFAAGELEVDCEGFYQEWSDIIEAASTCSFNTGFYEAYQACLGDAKAGPIVESEPESKIVAPPGLYDDQGFEETLLCSIDNAIRIEWFKLEKDFEVPVDRGNVLRFNLELSDQGTYYCVGHGGGMYKDMMVRTSPATLIIEGASTVVASIHFPDYNFSSELQESLQNQIPPGAELANSLQSWFMEMVNPRIRDAFAETGGDRPRAKRQGFDFYSSDDYGDFPPPPPPPPELRDIRVRAFLPVPTGDTTSTRIETVMYMYGFNDVIPDTNLTDVIKDILIETIPTLPDFVKSLDAADSSSVEIFNIGSCPEDETNDPYPLTWPQTQVNQVAESTEKCPEYSGTVGPRGTRECKGDLVSAPQWQDVVINECFGDDSEEINTVLAEISQNTVTKDNVTQVSSDLAEATNNTGEINATGLEAVALALESITNVESPSPEVTTSVIETIDNILNIEEEVFEAAVDQNAPTRILRSLEDQLTTLQKQGTNFTVSRTNIDVKAVQIPQTNIQNGIGFANIRSSDSAVGNTEIFGDPEDIPVDESDTSIALPPEVISRFRSEVNKTAHVPATFILYQNSKLFQSRRLEKESTNEIVRLVGTRVISATIEGLQVYDLAPDQPVTSTYLHKQAEDENTTLDNFQCAFWDFDLENGQGDWSNEGCRRVETAESDRSICHCDHLTSFAVLIDVHGQKYSALILDVFSTIGCGVSIAALIITLITYLAIKTLRTKIPKQILICLSFTLLCLYIVFLAGVDRTDSYAGCIVVAALLHYLTLSSVTWMGVEAVNLYLLVVKVFNADVSHFMLKASLAAWGAPLIPVILVFAIDTSQYVNEHHCFMQPSYAFYFADLLIIFLILIFNCVMFVMIIYKLTCGRKNIGRSSSGDKRQAVTRAITAVAITAILGLTWIFGFLTIIENRASSLAFQVLFCIFNSLQGFFIFLLFCVRPEEIRDEWKKWLACGKPGRGNEFSSTGRAGHYKATSSDAPKSTASSNLTSSKQPESVELLSKPDTQKSQIEPSSVSQTKPNEMKETESENLLSKSQDSKSSENLANDK
ncbi:uncharacterized protein [Amphiura filiformis]|uniref:uncharacterized protein n=1 Tax=Amphiura filiformis TaxID=82378 RepID=UPI003B214354